MVPPRMQLTQAAGVVTSIINVTMADCMKGCAPLVRSSCQYSYHCTTDTSTMPKNKKNFKYILHYFFSRQISFTTRQRETVRDQATNLKSVRLLVDLNVMLSEHQVVVLIYTILSVLKRSFDVGPS